MPYALLEKNSSYHSVKNPKHGLFQFVGFVLILFAFPNVLYLKRVVMERQTLSETYPQWGDLLKSIQYSILFIVLHNFVKFLLNPVGRAVIPMRSGWSTEVWLAKVDRFGSSVFKFTCYLTGTILLYSIVKNESWLPPVLGGRGDTRNCWVDGFPYQPVDVRLKTFFQWCLGFVLSDLFLYIAKERKRPDFSEVALHLLISSILMVFSYAGNMLRVASLVMMIHLVCDVFVFAAKSAVDTKFSGGALAYFPLLFVYLWCRIYVFAAFVLRTAMVEAPEVIRINNLVCWKFLIGLLGLTLLMHVYWGFVIIKIGLFLLITGQSKDLQANMEIEDDETESKRRSGGLVDLARRKQKRKNY